MTRHLAKCEAYYAARRAYDEAHAASQAAFAAMADTERELIDCMLDEGVKSFKLDDGTTVSMKRQFAISVNQDNEFLLREWLTEEEGDIELFSKKTLDKSAITARIKERIEAGTLDESTVPEFLKLNTRPSVMVMGWKKRSQ